MKTPNLKTTMLTMLAILGSATMFAQGLATTPESDANYDKGFRLGFGISPGYVFDDPYDFALGGDVRLQYDFSKRYSVTLTTGFTNFFAGDYEGVEIDDLGFVPVKAGFKAFFWEDEFYAMGEAGVGFAVTNDYDDTSAIIAPSIGWANKYFDLSLRYEYYSDFPSINDGDLDSGTGQIALRFAYGFRL